MAALPVSAKPGWKFSICNETFQGLPFPQACELTRKTGFQGIEIMPHTLALPPAEARRAMADAGIAYVGLHAVLSSPPGLNVVSPDAVVREKSWAHFRRVIDLCADLGSGGIIVLGSGKQRSGDSDDRGALLRDGLAQMTSHAQPRGVTILLEPLAKPFTNLINSLDESLALIRAVNSPALQTMLDVRHAAAESKPVGDLIRAHADVIRHIHVNELDGRHPGTGSYDYRPLFQALRDVNYTRWVSLEVFDFKAGGETIAREAITTLQTAARGI